MATKTKSKDKRKSNKKIEDLSMLDKATKSILNIMDDSYDDKEILDAKNRKFRSILNRELEISKGVSQGSIVDFVASLNLKNNSGQKGMLDGQNNSPNTNEMFTKNINDIFGYFQDLYRNKFIEMDDLKFISKFIPALGEAVKTILDSVVSSDNIAETVNRKIKLPSSTNEEDRVAIENEIKRAETELKLLKKLKNVVYKKTLVTGNYYVYAVPYSKIFEEYDMIKKKEKQQGALKPGSQFETKSTDQMAKESFVLGDVDISPAIESISSVLSSAKTDSGSALPKTDINQRIAGLMDNMPNITCDQSSIYVEAMESMEEIASSEYAYEAFKAKISNQGKNFNDMIAKNVLDLGMPDGTKSMDDVKPSHFEIGGTFIKYLDPKKVIPLKVFDQVIGYYLIHPKIKNNKNSAGEVAGINSIGGTLFSAVNIGEKKKHDAIEKIVDSISDGIMRNFSNKFVTKNVEYKKLIADCIMSNGLTDQDYNIQFVPAEDIVQFTVNENEDGFGESVLSDSLFPAKLLMSLIVCRLLNYINKTGNKTVSHIYKGPINAMTSNQVNRVIRDLQEQNVTFNDLLSPNLVFNKFNRDGNIALPRAQNGDKLVEFEQMDGQNIEMSPEYEKELENMAILGTGVPTVIMEYAGSADFAKQLVSANIKFAGRVASLQSDLEDATTLLYKKICMNSGLSDAQKTLVMENLKIELPRPRVLTNSNNGEYVQSIVQTAESIADVALGRDTIQDTEKVPNGLKIKEQLMYSITRDSAPFIDWDNVEKEKERIMLEYSEQKKSEDASGGGSPF